MAIATLRDYPRDLSRIPIEVHTEPVYSGYNDPVYFHKSQVKVRTKLVYKGRRSGGTTWVVQRIHSLKQTDLGPVRTFPQATSKLSDYLELRCEETGEIRKLRFSYLTDTARWRLEE